MSFCFSSLLPRPAVSKGAQRRLAVGAADQRTEDQPGAGGRLGPGRVGEDGVQGALKRRADRLRQLRRPEQAADGAVPQQGQRLAEVEGADVEPAAQKGDEEL